MLRTRPEEKSKAEELVGDILSKSGLEEEIVADVWEQTCGEFVSPVFDPAQEGAWTEFEILVALHMVQEHCGIDHTALLQKMAGPRQYERAVQRARSSYKMVRNRTRSSQASDESAPPMPGADSLSPLSMTHSNNSTTATQTSISTPSSPLLSYREPSISSTNSERPMPTRPSSVMQLANHLEAISLPSRNDSVRSMRCPPVPLPTRHVSERRARSPLARPPEPSHQPPPPPRMPGSWDSPVETPVNRTTSRSSGKSEFQTESRIVDVQEQPGLEVAVTDGIEVVQYQPFTLPTHSRHGSRSRTPNGTTFEFSHIAPEVVQPSLEVVEPAFNPYTVNRPASPVLDPWAHLRGPELQPSLEVATSPRDPYQMSRSGQASPRISPQTQLPEPLFNQTDSTFEMAQPPTVRRYDIQRRLSQLSVTHVPARHARPPLENLVEAEASTPGIDILVASSDDRDRAHHYLTGLRLRDPTYKPPSTLFKSKKTVERMTNPENFVFSQSEKNRAFDLAIARNEDGGLIAGLIEMGAQINITVSEASSKLWKIGSKREGEDQRNDALMTVASNRRLDLVRLLACQGADQDSRDSALLEVTRSMFPDIVRELVFRRANPNAYDGKILESAVSCKREDIVRLLLQAPVTLDQRYATNSLPVAVKAGELSIVESLIEYGADVNYQKGVSLQMAVRMGRVDILLVLLAGKPSTENLNAAATLVLDDTTNKASRASKLQKYELLECLLCSGAGGSICEGILERAVIAHHLEVVALLLSHDVAVRSKSLEMSVANCRIPMLRLLLEGSYDKAVLPKLLERIPNNAPNKVHYEITKSLLLAGAKGHNLSVALVKATMRQDTETASMLIDYNASVNYNEAQALQIAVKSGNVDMLHVLLTGRPSKESVNFAFPLIPRNDRAFKLSMTLLLLRNGASGHAVSSALVDAVSDRTEVNDTDLIETLLEHKADPNFRNGQALQIASRRGKKDILALILRYKPKVETISEAVSAAMDIKSPETCFKTLQILLLSGATGSTVSQALNIALEKSPAFDNVAKLLLEHKANPNHAEGKALLTAVARCTPELLSSILATNLCKGAVRSKAFSAAFSSGTQDKAKKLEILLKSRVSSTAISDGLIHEVAAAQPDLTIIQLLLHHGADVNYRDGRVIQTATTSANVELLTLLVSNQVTKETLVHAIPLAMELKLHKTRSEVLEVLLKTAQNTLSKTEIRGIDQFGAAVVTEVKRSDPSQAILEQLLKAGANAAYNKGEAIQHATSTGNIEVLEMLIAKTGSANILGRAIPHASSSSSKTQKHKLMKMLLDAGAQGVAVDEALVKAVNDGDEVLANLLLEHNASIDHNGGQCVLDAVKNGRGKVLDTLLRYLPSQATVDATFGLIIEPLKNGKKNTELLRIILQYHPSSPLISAFLEESIPGAVDVPGRYMVHLLLDAGASVDYHGGAALKHAAKKGDIELIQKMLNLKPRAETVSNAFLEVFDCDSDQETLTKMLDLFLTCHCPPALEAYARDQSNPLVLAMTQQSHAPEIAEMLLLSGCSADCLFESSLERKSFAETVTPLLWLLRQESARTKCRTLVTALLKAKANPNFKSTTLGKTPMILATQYQSLNIVTELLAFEADFSAEDSSNRTPLSYAAEQGDSAIMQALIKAGAPTNDGSLLYAARGCQTRCVQLLLEHEADINLRGRNGLTPLGELCLNGEGGQLIKQPLKTTLRLLLTANPDLNLQSDGKSCLLLALDNPKPIDITKALLEAGIRNSINDDVHLYRSHKQHCYSPTMYVKQGINKADTEHMPELLRILRMFGCKDRFWNAGPGPQPQGACGFPPDVKRRVEEEDRIEAQRLAGLELERVELERVESERRRAALERQVGQLQSQREGNVNVGGRY